MKHSHLLKKTKIVATIGPASQPLPIMEKMVKEGLNVVRMNFSHGDFETHTKTIKNARVISTKLQVAVTLLQDLCGPKIRIGEVENDSITLAKGKKVILTTKKCLGTSEKMFINYKKLPAEVAKGQVIYIEDGKKQLKVLSSNGTDEIICKIIVGGMLKSRKGVNVPGANLSLSSLTAKDKKDLVFGLENNVDYVAMSFVRSAKDIIDLKKRIKKSKSQAKVIAKIETQEAIECFDDILEEVDGIMVARGDLAVEVGHAKVPLLQKMMIEKCMNAGKPVIVATQMLDSMEQNPVPTRAEVSDVANAILGGADAVMLSGETSIGKYPVQTIQTMASIAKECEDLDAGLSYYTNTSHDVTEATAYSAISLADMVEAKYIVPLTSSGKTATTIAKYRPAQPVLTFCHHRATALQTNLVRGVVSFLIQPPKNFENAVALIKKELQKEKLVKKGDRAVITAGHVFGTPGGTNTVHCVEF